MGGIYGVLNRRRGHVFEESQVAGMFALYTFESLKVTLFSSRNTRVYGEGILACE